MSTTDNQPGVGTNPQQVREREFPVRLRGLDPDEVYPFLDRLADELERAHRQVTELTADKDRLLSELERTAAAPQERVNDQAVMLLTQAQQVADTLIEEAVQSARDLLMTARSQQRDVLTEADQAAQEAVGRATASLQEAGNQDSGAHSVEYVKTFAKVAQVQFKAVLDALNDQVERLSELTEIDLPSEGPGSPDPLDTQTHWRIDDRTERVPAPRTLTP